MQANDKDVFRGCLRLPFETPLDLASCQDALTLQQSERIVIKNASLSLSVSDPSASMDAIAVMAEVSAASTNRLAIAALVRSNSSRYGGVGVLRHRPEALHEINEGIGVHKSPSLYGAFPTDPYSHTPANKGAQQPGMTGQVKEDVISRFGEMGINIRQGKISFDILK